MFVYGIKRSYVAGRTNCHKPMSCIMLNVTLTRVHLSLPQSLMRPWTYDRLKHTEADINHRHVYA